MTPFVLLSAVLLGLGTSPSPSLYAGYAERPHAGYAITVSGFELAEEQVTGAIRVSGRVARPGTYAYYPGMTVSDAIGKAGSFLSRADYEEIRVVRPGEGRDVCFRLSYNIMPHRLALLKPGDTVVVPDELYY